MDEQFGERNAAIRVAWGPRGPKTKRTEWAAYLGVDVTQIRNLEKGHKIQGGDITDLANVYAALSPRGVNPRALATWAWAGDGEMPRPAGAVVPNVSAPSPLQSNPLQAAHAWAIRLKLLESEGVPPSGDDAKEGARLVLEAHLPASDSAKLRAAKKLVA